MSFRILHITNWYPDSSDQFKGSWIAKHIRALDNFCHNDVVHIEVNSNSFNLNKTSVILGNKALRFNFPFHKWFIKEILTGFLVMYVIIFKIKVRNYNIINFHIAYPLCTYLHIYQSFIRKPIIITEHWSAYHFNFGVKKNLNRVKRIFKNNVTFITVSDALKKDLLEFSKKKNLKVLVIPNIVNTNIFNYKNKEKQKCFFMVSYWKKPKNPIAILKAFKYLIDHNPDILLRIGGFGPQVIKIHDYINKLKLQNNVQFIGILKPKEIAEEMNKALGFIHCSNYETFSVVCAEALCCGTPVIASSVGGINEVVDNSSGILVKNNTVENWFKEITKFTNSYKNYNSERISKNAIKRFSEKRVGKEYMNVLFDCYNKSIK